MIDHKEVLQRILDDIKADFSAMTKEDSSIIVDLIWDRFGKSPASMSQGEIFTCLETIIEESEVNNCTDETMRDKIEAYLLPCALEETYIVTVSSPNQILVIHNQEDDEYIEETCILVNKLKDFILSPREFINNFDSFTTGDVLTSVAYGLIEGDFDERFSSL